MKKGIAVDLSEVENQISALEAKHDADHLQAQEEISALGSNAEDLEAFVVSESNAINTEIDSILTEIANAGTAISGLESDVAALSNELYLDIRVAVSNHGQEISDLQGDLSGLHAAVSNLGTEDLLSNIQANEDAISGLSNDLSLNYITTSALNEQLQQSYIQQSEKTDFVVDTLRASNVETTSITVNEDHGLVIAGVNFIDILDELRDEINAASVLPSNITLSELDVKTITNSDYFPGIIGVDGSLIPSTDNLHQLGDPEHRWIEGHFTAVYANNLFAKDGTTSRRVLLEGDESHGLTVEWEDILNEPAWIQVSQCNINISGFNMDVDLTGPAGPVGAKGDTGDTGPAGPAGPAGTTSWSGITDLPAWTAKLSYLDIGAHMWPPETSNFDVIVQDSITPITDVTYNLGQHGRRYRNLFAEAIQTSALRCAEGGSIYLGSYDSTVLGDTHSWELRPNANDNKVLDLHSLSNSRIFADTVNTSDLRCIGSAGSATLSMGVSSYLPNLNNRIKNLAYATGNLDACPREQIRGWDSSILSQAQSYTDDQLNNINCTTLTASGAITGDRADLTTTVTCSNLVASGGVFVHELNVQENATIDGILNMGLHKIASVLTPTEDNDAATKAYCDALVSGLSTATPIEDWLNLYGKFGLLRIGIQDLGSGLSVEPKVNIYYDPSNQPVINDVQLRVRVQETTNFQQTGYDIRSLSEFPGGYTDNKLYRANPYTVNYSASGVVNVACTINITIDGATKWITTKYGVISDASSTLRDYFF